MSKSIDTHGYAMIYMPNHHRAKVNGMVAEHIVVAEEMLERPLRDLEEVHHEDRNRTNNSPENLYVFATKEDHVRYHHNGIMVKIEDYYISPSVAHDKANCEICGKEFDYKITGQTGKYCSRKCVHESQKRAERPSRDELLEMIKTKPFVQIGKLYGVSDNAVRKWCKSYGLPYTKKEIKGLF